MGKPSELIETLFEKFENYRKTTYELTKLSALEAIFNATTSILFRMIVYLLMSLFVIVFSIGVALWLGESLGKTYYGFFIVAFFYLISGLICLYILKDWLKTRINNFIITRSFPEDEENK